MEHSGHGEHILPYRVTGLWKEGVSYPTNATLRLDKRISENSSHGVGVGGSLGLG